MASFGPGEYAGRSPALECESLLSLLFVQACLHNPAKRPLLRLLELHRKWVCFAPGNAGILPAMAHTKSSQKGEIYWTYMKMGSFRAKRVWHSRPRLYGRMGLFRSPAQHRRGNKMGSFRTRHSRPFAVFQLLVSLELRAKWVRFATQANAT